jgi:hypothetical protein
MFKIDKSHRYLIRRNTDRKLIGSTDDRGIVLPEGHGLIDTVGEDGLGPGIARYMEGNRP